MWVFDASSIILAWDNYPLDQFPSLWRWIGGQGESLTIAMPDVALDEVGHKNPECLQWLKDRGIRKVEPDDSILGSALAIKALLTIGDDNYHPRGVDENDIFVVATSKRLGWSLVSDESPQ